MSTLEYKLRADATSPCLTRQWVVTRARLYLGLQLFQVPHWRWANELYLIIYQTQSLSVAPAHWSPLWLSQLAAPWSTDMRYYDILNKRHVYQTAMERPNYNWTIKGNVLRQGCKLKARSRCLGHPKSYLGAKQHLICSSFCGYQ